MQFIVYDTLLMHDQFTIIKQIAKSLLRIDDFKLKFKPKDKFTRSNIYHNKIVEFFILDFGFQRNLSCYGDWWGLFVSFTVLWNGLMFNFLFIFFPHLLMNHEFLCNQTLSSSQSYIFPIS